MLLNFKKKIIIKTINKCDTLNKYSKENGSKLFSLKYFFDKLINWLFILIMNLFVYIELKN